MTSFRPRRPSTSLVISLIALFAALGGTAYASVTLGKSSVNTKQLKNGAVTNKKLANGSVGTGKLKNGAVTARKINPTGLTVPNALHANTANSAGSAINATNATNAANSQPDAFAQVTDTGVLVSANSKNVGTVTQAGTSYYCLSGIPFAVRGGQATVDSSDSPGGQFAEFGLGVGRTPCPANTQAFVLTLDSTSENPITAGFFVQLYG